MTLDASDYEDDVKPREVPNGPHYRSRELRQVERAQLFRAVEQVEARGYTLARHETRPATLPSQDEERRAAVERTRHLSAIQAAEVLGLNRETVRVWRKRWA